MIPSAVSASKSNPPLKTVREDSSAAASTTSGESEVSKKHQDLCFDKSAFPNMFTLNILN
jgi:hypothetical protein